MDERAAGVSSSDPRNDIMDAVHRSWWTVDRDMGLGGELHFAQDGECIMPAVTMKGREQIAQGYARRHSNGPRISRHLLSNMIVDHAGDRAVARYALSLFAGIGAPPLEVHTPSAICDVRDDWQLIDHIWLITRRALEAVFVAPGNDSVMLRAQRS